VNPSSNRLDPRSLRKSEKTREARDAPQAIYHKEAGEECNKPRTPLSDILAFPGGHYG